MEICSVSAFSCYYSVKARDSLILKSAISQMRTKLEKIFHTLSGGYFGTKPNSANSQAFVSPDSRENNQLFTINTVFDSHCLGS